MVATNGVDLANTTLGVLVVTINSSIVTISLPAIFRGIKLDPPPPWLICYLSAVGAAAVLLPLAPGPDGIDIKHGRP